MAVLALEALGEEVVEAADGALVHGVVLTAVGVAVKGRVERDQRAHETRQGVDDVAECEGIGGGKRLAEQAAVARIVV